MAGHSLPISVVNEALSVITAARKRYPDYPWTGPSSRHCLSAVVMRDLRERWKMSDSSIKHRIVMVRTKYEAAFDAAVGGMVSEVETPEEPEIKVEDVELAEAPKPPPRERTYNEERELHAARANAAYDKQRLKEAFAEIEKLVHRLRLYESVEGHPFRPAEWATRPLGLDKSEHMPYLLTSDFQVAEVIRPEETEHAHGYNIEIFRQRYRELINATIDISFNHQMAWHYPGIIYARGGDTISGGIHDELVETDELTPIDSVIVAAEEEAGGIVKLADAFGRVQVYECGGGNHDRNTKKMHSKGSLSHSYDKLVSYILRKQFKGDSRVSFHGTESPDVYFSIYDTKILLTHGDKIGSRGGQGFVGPAATILRGAQKVIMEQAAIGRRVDEVHMGHFHTALDMGFVVVNGGMPGYSEFAKLNRMRPEPPMQLLRYYHPNRGVVDTKKLKLA